MRLTLHRCAVYPIAMLACLSCVAVACAESSVIKDRVQFNRDILPILSDRCFHCHGPDEVSREGGVRFDLEASAKGEADSGETPVVPGKPDASELLRRLTTDTRRDGGAHSI